MEITISENLCEFRKNKENTQEELAGFLGITTQSVSKWERGESLLGITLLPAIAEFYNVTIDEIMGFGKIKKERRIRELLESFDHNLGTDSMDEKVRRIRDAVKEFPNEYRIIVKLMWILYNSGNPIIFKAPFP